MPGVCVLPGFCAYADGECESGYRFGPQAEPGRENACVSPEESESLGGTMTATDTSAGSTSNTATSSDATSGSPLTSGSATTPTPTTADPSGSATMDLPTSETTVSETDSSTGPQSNEAKCDAAYGAAPSYMLCEATEASCLFYFEPLMMVTCSYLCEQYGGTCVEVIDTDPPDACTPLADNNQDCLTVYNNAMCSCTLP